MRHDKVLRLAAVATAVFAAVAAGCDSGVAPAQVQLQLSAAPSSIPANGTSIITAQLTNTRGQALSGVLLEWSNSLAQLELTGSATDSSGRNSATLRGEGTAGVAVVTARVVGSTERSQVQVRVGLD
jgi:hypothetical protein